MGDQLHQVGREEIMKWKAWTCSYIGYIPEPQWDISHSTVASQIVGKMPKFSIFSEGSIQKGEVSFEQWAFEVKSVMQSHKEVTLWDEIA